MVLATADRREKGQTYDALHHSSFDGASADANAFLRYQRENLAAIARGFSGTTYSDACIALGLAADSAAAFIRAEGNDL